MRLDALFDSSRRPSGRGLPLKKVVFVSYGAFDSNSGGHIAGFASELRRRGYAVGVCAREPVADAYAFGPPTYEFFSHAQLARDPRAGVAFDGVFEPEQTLLVCWTPRRVSGRAVIQASRVCDVPYVIHMEDNEDQLTWARLGPPGADGQDGAPSAIDADNAARRWLIRGAAGVTVIAERLKEGLPHDKPCILLEPGVDFGLFCEPLAPVRKTSLLRAAGVAAGSTVIVYPGNIHKANVEEMAQLYRAIRLTRGRGHDVALIKTGNDDVNMRAVLGYDPANHGVTTVGNVDRRYLIDLLKCADIFVQPGAPGPFNDYRLPSKLPELLAIGRPVLLPRANVGLKLRHGVDAILLETGSAKEIAKRIERVLGDPALARALSSNARRFARRAYRWDRQGRRLESFLTGIQRARTACPGV